MKREIIKASLSAIIAVVLFAAPASAQAVVRSSVGVPLEQAMHLIKARDYDGATPWVNKADAVPNKTADEQSLIRQFREMIRVKWSSDRP